MKALRYYDNRDIRVEDIPAPAGELGPHEVLVRITHCGICGSDLHEYLDGPLYSPGEPHPQTGASRPTIMGHEFSGVVEGVGGAVASVAVGDRVAGMPQRFCGTCRQCLRGRQQTCERLAAVGYSTRWGGLAEYGVFDDDQVFALPEGVSNVLGALVEPTAVAVHAVEAAPVAIGDVVLITGGGPIGLLVAMCARAAGAGRILLSEPHDARRARAEALGFCTAVDPRVESLAEVVAAATDGAGADVCIECSGSAPAVASAFEAVRLGGTIVQTAMASAPISIDTSARLTMRDVIYKGVYCYDVTSWPKVIGLIASGAIDPEPLVTSRVPLERAPEAFDALLDPTRDEVKILITGSEA
ncbi:alcohol dehydrogenase catalytic domain-containing protein [Gulosibacter sp. 10]|uniref:alcohol dehydrogenase catalytic domain-containing protein n=1 Tax=Gulosibacter sp. 10 TaxID=1255570 RepID=UPI00097EC38D|nr:alcohol dehydrogenase catalytic domain-containing protein [Gulosibacter sp. 10]SJM56088.1 2,3-butanediol dehydrogenase, R-alcohol forming, (R)-and (S)-acetoin-specific [Gulosibacter sp. 10]